MISVPAGAGFGLPTGYFLLQALGITLERWRQGVMASSHHTPDKVTAGSRHSLTIVPHWLFTHAFTALPAFFLFHPPFVERVMLPFFHAIGALP